MDTAVQTCYRHPDQPTGVICQRCDRPICPRCMNQASVGFHCPECTSAGRQKVYRGPGAFRTRPVLTQVLIAVNVLVFLVDVARSGGDSIRGNGGTTHYDFGLIAKFTSVSGDVIPSLGGVGEGEWYRMVTSGFLHYGFLHLLMNMYALWLLGNSVEHMGGRARMGAIYAVSLLGGSLGALVLDPAGLTAGASGAVFGLMGAILLAQRAQGVAFRDSPLLGVLILNLVITIGIPGISLGGHLGGFLAGAGAGWLLLDYGQRPGVNRQATLAASAALGVALVAVGTVFATGWTP